MRRLVQSVLLSPVRASALRLSSEKRASKPATSPAPTPISRRGIIIYHIYRLSEMPRLICPDLDHVGIGALNGG
jgi:hypothetical protein